MATKKMIFKSQLDYLCVVLVYDAKFCNVSFFRWAPNSSTKSDNFANKICAEKISASNVEKSVIGW